MGDTNSNLSSNNLKHVDSKRSLKDKSNSNSNQSTPNGTKKLTRDLNGVPSDLVSRGSSYRVFDKNKLNLLNLDTREKSLDDLFFASRRKSNRSHKSNLSSSHSKKKTKGNLKIKSELKKQLSTKSNENDGLSLIDISAKYHKERDELIQNRNSIVGQSGLLTNRIRNPKHITHNQFNLSNKEVVDLVKLRRSLTKRPLEKKIVKKTWFQVPQPKKKSFFESDELRNIKKAGVFLSTVTGIEEFKDPKVFQEESNNKMYILIIIFYIARKRIR